MRRDSKLAWSQFRDRVGELGGTVVEPSWLGSSVPHRVLCGKGHEGRPRPSDIWRGKGFCRPCAGNDPATAERQFRDRVIALGGTVLEPRWLGKDTPHRVRCAKGHEGRPRPGDVRNGKGICRTCAGQDPATAERQFRERVAARGGVVLEPVWLGNHVPHLVRCADGHETRPRPGNTQRGQGFCRVCAVRDPAIAERQFQARVTGLGGMVAYQGWRGVDTPHAVICAQGHECAPRPSDLTQGGGPCRICLRMDPAEDRFRARVEALGGRVTEPAWRGNKIPHAVICPAGHECRPRPNDVLNGDGICRFCAGKQWDIFYVVEDPLRRHLKFGITSGSPQPRLRHHAIKGFTKVNLVLTGLPGTVAPEMETATIATLRLAGECPIQGREYFDSSVLGLVLDIAVGFADLVPGP